jgi:hypothetical protein
MSDPKKPTATHGSDDLVASVGVAQPKNVERPQTDEGTNSISENSDGDGQHRIKKEVKEATDLPQKGAV